MENRSPDKNITNKLNYSFITMVEPSSTVKKACDYRFPKKNKKNQLAAYILYITCNTLFQLVLYMKNYKNAMIVLFLFRNKVS